MQVFATFVKTKLNFFNLLVQRKFALVIVIKSWPSAVIGSFQDFEQEKSEKTVMIFC